MSRSKSSANAQIHVGGAPAPSHAAAVPEVVVGQIISVTAREIRVDFARNDTGAPLAARTTVAIGPDAAGREVALAFVAGDLRRPVITGLFCDGGAIPTDAGQVEVDGEQVTLTGQKRIVLRCGKASITLTAEGKVLIRGEYVHSHSSGVARFQGGVVLFN